MKDLARRTLQSDDWHDAHQGFGLLCKITDEVAEQQLAREIRNGIEYRTMESLKLVSLFLDSYDEYRSGGSISVVQRLDRAKEETAFYFAAMFKAGHFEQLPMPEFGYEISDENILGYLNPRRPISMPGGKPEPCWGDDR
jgi:hypothetical protein